MRHDPIDDQELGQTVGWQVIVRRSWPTWLACLLMACAAGGQPGPVHRPTGVTTPLPAADQAAYVANVEKVIVAANEAVGAPPLDPAVLADRLPFELVPPATCRRRADGRHQRGALLIHGLGGTPYVLRDLGRHLARACYLVRAILLPGHGTAPGDLLTVDRQAWRRAVQLGVASFDGRVAEVDLVGFSEGAGLALDYVTHHAPPDDLAIGALVLLSPVVAPRRSPVLAPAVTLYDAVVPGTAWVELRPQLDALRYDSLPRHAALEMDRLLDEIGPGPLDLPVFVALSATDAEVDAEVVRRWFCRGLSGPRALIWYTSDPAPVTDCRFVTPRTPVLDDGILDLSHDALPVAPDNPRYGREATTYDCWHYYLERDTPVWLRCVDPANTPENSTVRYGEITPRNLSRHIVRRLTWNPDFDALTIDVLAFLAHLSRAPRPSAKPAPET